MDAPKNIPDSYASLPTKEIKLSHNPETSSTATPVIVVTLYRPGKHNAFTPTMMEELEHVFQLFDLDDRVRCVVVTGHGNIFCAGADLVRGFGGGKNGPNAERVNDHRDGGGRVVLAIHRCRKPVIGAIQGSAVGIGITMTLPMAIRVAYAPAKVGFVFSRRGLVMEACSSYFLPRLIGFARAMHVTTTGATYKADDKIWGPLFSEMCERREDVKRRALEIADEVAKNTSTVSTALMRDLMWRDKGSAEEQHLLDSKILYELFSSNDNTEGVRSFMEKRPPKFTDTLETSAPAAYPWWTPVETIGAKTVEARFGRSKL
ncbi:enoyl-CoA hydratase/isomerase family protein [Phyllosticta capitalensis]